MFLFSEIRSLKYRRPAIQGWCSPEKAQVLAELILQNAPSVIVEIGVYGGSSLIPMAIAAKHVGNGCRVIGIDPWDTSASLEGMRNDDNLAFWGKVDHGKIKQSCEYHLRKLGLDGICQLQQARASAVVNLFDDDSIGLLHLDGNHSAEPAMRDAREWLPKVAAGGFIVVDDIGWTEDGEQTVWPAVEWMLENGCEIVDESIENSIVLRKAATP